MERNLGLDVMRIVLALAVIGLHTGVLADIDPRWNYLLVFGLFRVAVPIFLVINGYYLFDTFRDGGYGAWLRRTAGLYAFWAVVYLPIYARHAFSSHSDFVDFVMAAVLGYWHLWYVVALLPAAALLHALRNRSGSTLLGVAAALYFVGCALQWETLYGPRELSNLLYRSFLLDALPFMITGYVIRREDFRPSLPACLAAVFVGTVGLLAESLACRAWSPRSDKVDLLASLALLGPALFLAVRHVQFATRRSQLARLSSSMYLVHIAVLAMCAKWLKPGAGHIQFMIVAAGSLALAPAVMLLARRFPVVLGGSVNARASAAKAAGELPPSVNPTLSSPALQ